MRSVRRSSKLKTAHSLFYDSDVGKTAENEEFSTLIRDFLQLLVTLKGKDLKCIIFRTIYIGK